MEPLVLGVALGAVTLRTYRPTAVAVLAAGPPDPGGAGQGDGPAGSAGGYLGPGELRPNAPAEPQWGLAFTVGGSGPGPDADQSPGAVGRLAAGEDAALLEVIRRYAPALVAVAAPLTYPSGVRGYGVRACDLELSALPLEPAARAPLAIRAGISTAHRGAALRLRIDRLGVRLVEVYPPATLMLLRAGGAADLVDVRRFERPPQSPAEEEAVVAAYQGWLCLCRRAVPVGHGGEGLVFIPAARVPPA